MREQPRSSPDSPIPHVGRRSQQTGFGSLLKDHRLRAGYSQEHLAEKARISSETIGALERGTRRAPYADTLELLIHALELIGDERIAFETAAATARAQRTDRRTKTTERAYLFPAPLTPLVGRDEHVAKLGALIAQNRLVTVTGIPGVGKSRVVVEVAKRHFQDRSDEVWLVDLAAHSEHASLPAKVASVIGGLRTCSSAAELRAALGTRRLLLVFDNCEHVISETATVAFTLVQGCPGVSVLVASSERLGVLGETLFRLPSLSVPHHVPASVQEARCYSAVALFIDRAEAEANVLIPVDKLKQTVMICQRLDGIPRAIELAATRLAVLGFDNLLSRLNERDVLAGGGRDLPARKRAPREAIVWSYAGLPAFEQMLFRRLATFTTGHTLEDAEAVCTDDALERARVADVLDSLVHKSLVAVVHSNSTISYRVLEVARSYGLEKLAESGELERYSIRHAQWLQRFSSERHPTRSDVLL